MEYGPLDIIGQIVAGSPPPANVCKARTSVTAEHAWLNARVETVVKTRSARTWLKD